MNFWTLLPLFYRGMQVLPEGKQLHELFKPEIDSIIAKIPTATPLVRHILNTLAPDFVKQFRGEGTLFEFSVRDLQTYLQQLGHPVAIDGDYGEQTKAAVKEFQKKTFPDNPKEWDGLAGPWTAFHIWKAVNR